MKKIAEGKRVVILENDGWEYVERKKGKEAVAVIAQDDEGRVILTEQFRNPVGKRVVDYPAGLVGDEEGTNDPAETAKKELDEETGFTCERVELLADNLAFPKGIEVDPASKFLYVACKVELGSRSNDMQVR